MPEPTAFDESSVNIDEIDFSDLEAQYAVEDNSSLTETYIIVDGAPIAPESKAPILSKVLKKLFSQAGKILDFELPLENGKTKGFLIIGYENQHQVEKSIKLLNGKKLDVKHRLLVNKLSDIEKYAIGDKVVDEFTEPAVPEFKSHGYLKSWLLDPVGRDQFLLHYGNDVGVYWHKSSLQAEEVIEPRSNWTSAFMKFSPKGSYLFSMMPKGVQAWGGENFDRINRFVHPGVRLIDISPNEKFLVTLSPDPIHVPDDDDPQRANCPFGSESENHKLVIWDLTTGLPARTFALPPNLETTRTMPWPLIKWSYNDQYCARMGPDALAIYDTTDFSLLDKKLIKIEGITDFDFAPSGVKLASTKKNDPLDVILAYWTPEQANQSAKVAIMHVPNKTVLRTVNLVQVSDVKLYWQEEAKYLCCKVDRHTKSGKTKFTNLEVFQLFEKDIPVEKIEMTDVVVDFAWEPKGPRFVVIHKKFDAEENIAMPNNSISFYDVEDFGKGKKMAAVLKKWINFKTIQGKHSNHISFCPKGRFVIVSTLKQVGSTLEFYDFDYDGEKEKDQSNKVSSNVKMIKSQDQNGVHFIKWDPSGRYAVAFSTSWKSKIENGYKIYNMVGKLVKEELIDDFKDFSWRPRPASLLTANDRKRVRKDLKNYSIKFKEIDEMETNAELREVILRRKQLLQEWTSWRAAVDQKLKDLELTEHHHAGKEEVIEEIKEEVLEEKEEEVAE